MVESEERVNTGKAFGIITAVILINLGLFVAPLALSTKVYLYFFLLVIPAYIFLKKQYSKETSNSVFVKGKLWDNLNIPGKISLIYIVGYILYCGSVQFFMYYFGNELFFSDISMCYISSAAPLIIHWVIKLFKEKEKALQYISDIFSLWIIGYGLVWLSILFWFIILESD